MLNPYESEILLDENGTEIICCIMVNAALLGKYLKVNKCKYTNPYHAPNSATTVSFVFKVMFPSVLLHLQQDHSNNLFLSLCIQKY